MLLLLLLLLLFWFCILLPLSVFHLGFLCLYLSGRSKQKSLCSSLVLATKNHYIRIPEISEVQLYVQHRLYVGYSRQVHAPAALILSR